MHQKTAFMGVGSSEIRQYVRHAFMDKSDSWDLYCPEQITSAGLGMIFDDFDVAIVDQTAHGIRCWEMIGTVCDKDFPLVVIVDRERPLEVSGPPYDQPAVALISNAPSELIMIPNRAAALLQRCFDWSYSKGTLIRSASRRPSTAFTGPLS